MQGRVLQNKGKIKENITMKVTCEKQALSAALGTVGRAVSNRNTISILNNVLIECEGDKLKFTATDLDTFVVCTVDAKIETAGSIAVPAKVFSDIVSRMPNAPIGLEVKDGKMKVSCGKSSYNVLCMGADDFPATKTVDDGVLVEVNQGVLKDALKLTTFAASAEENRNILMGVLFAAEGDKLSLVSTDTHRLAKLDAPLILSCESPVKVVIPARALIEIERLIKDGGEEPVSLKVGKSSVLFQVGETTIVSRLLDGQFPNYEKVLPTSHNTEIFFERTELLDALKRLLIVAHYSAEKVVFKASGGTLSLSSESADVGSGGESIGVTIEGADCDIAFNAKYLIEVLERIESKQASLRLIETLKSGLVKVVNDNQVQDNFDYVVMPMQI